MEGSLHVRKIPSLGTINEVDFRLLQKLEGYKREESLPSSNLEIKSFNTG